MIDLGEMAAGGPGAEEPALPRAPLPYRWILGLLTVVLVAVLGGAAPPAPPPEPPVTLPLALRDGMWLIKDRLYLFGFADVAAGVPRDYTIRAHALPGAAPLGEYSVTLPGEMYSVTDGGDGLLLIGYQVNESGTTGVMAVRPGSGPPVWKREAMLFGAGADDSQALVFSDVAVPGRPNRRAWQGIDKRTGTTRWSVEIPVGGQFTVSNEFLWAGVPDLLYLLRPDGRLEVLDGTTGRITTATRVPAPVMDGQTYLMVASGVATVTGGGRTVAFDARTLAPRWETPEPVTSQENFPVSCPAVLCFLHQGNGLSGLDAATGRVLWQQQGWDVVQPLGSRLLVSASGRPEAGLAVLDPATGRVTARVGAWTFGGPGPEPDSAYVYRHQPVDGTLFYGVLDVTTGRTEVLGSAERVTGDCQFGPITMVCRRLDGLVSLWRL
ncbi:hypothetical protein MB27_27060 [Actinoplanes utahensis]|uniref:Pyrrolo-quinoline quinone repeat domain-containing protein n=1 Tax=Actinoplanes utahensis TaxID=1869 RepID=A0A0A6UKE1_ACTUT|nr:hypothetical protein MB27_35940 [Actinoplanes utahensis]KHD74769.1 hypothetical protein MB27_27060 [Actinoplanes utahensis]